MCSILLSQVGESEKTVSTSTLSYVEIHQSGLKTAMAKDAAADAMKRSGFALHGLGVDMAEGTPKSFQAGNVICYEPLFTAGGQGFFVEDTLLITSTEQHIQSCLVGSDQIRASASNSPLRQLG